MPNLQGFLDGFQTLTTLDCQQVDTTISMATAGMIPGLQYHVRIDDTNPPTTFEYAVVEFQDAGTAHFVAGGAGRGIGGTTAAFHPLGSFVTAVLLRESLIPTFARLDTQNAMAFSSASMVSGLAFQPYGVATAVAPTRYVGATTGGAPTSGGPFLVGDFVLDAVNGVIFICQVAGSPGMWDNILGGVNTGLSGPVSSLTRWIGATGGGQPTGGPWNQGDFITDRQGSFWVCTLPGAPGTWQSLPMGILAGGYNQAVVNQGSIVGSIIDLNNMGVTVVVGAGRRIKITAQALFTSSANDTRVQMSITEAAAALNVGEVDLRINSQNYTCQAIAVLQPSIGSHTYRARAIRNVGAGTVTLIAGATFPAFVVVEDIGGV